MNVMNRPLFRQAGGPMEPMPADMMPPAPAPMPADMGMGAAPPPPPPDMGMAMEQAQMEGMEEGANVAGQYMAETLMNIDGSENYESLINGLRGNEMPLQARYAELAEFVGPEDAQATPESVLALTQPGIMMTEQGAANSGIGQLMQGMVDDVAMTTDTGPTPMGQGIGELMMSGAPEAPVPQNFRYGGAVGMHKGTPVQKFKDGMGAASNPYLAALAGGTGSNQSFAERTKGTYEDVLPLFQDLVPEPYTKGQFLLDIAQSGLAYAGGRDPLTGENMAGQSGLSQLARAAAPLPAKLSQAVADTRKSQQAVKTAALQAGLQRAQTQEESEQAMQLALLEELYGDNVPKIENLQMKNGEIKAFDTGTQGGLRAYLNAVDTGEGTPMGDPTFKERIVMRVGTNLASYADNTLDSALIDQMRSDIDELYGEKTTTTYDAGTGQYVPAITQKSLPATVLEAERKRYEAGLPISRAAQATFDDEEARAKSKLNISEFDPQDPSFDETNEVDAAIEELEITEPVTLQNPPKPEDRVFTEPEIVVAHTVNRGKETIRRDLEAQAADQENPEAATYQEILDELAAANYFEQGFGSPAAVTNWINKIWPAVTFGAGAPADEKLDLLMAKMIELDIAAQTAIIQARGQRVSESALNEIRKTFAKPAAFFESKEAATAKLRATRESLANTLATLRKKVEMGILNPTQLTDTMQQLRTIKWLYQSYDKILGGLQQVNQTGESSEEVNTLIQSPNIQEPNT